MPDGEKNRAFQTLGRDFAMAVARAMAIAQPLKTSTAADTAKSPSALASEDHKQFATRHQEATRKAKAPIPVAATT